MQEPFLGRVTDCQACGNATLETILDLGHHPITQAYLTRETLAVPEATYPLMMIRCGACGLCQLSYVVDPKIVFPPDYPYQTGMTKMLIDNFRGLTSLLTDRYKLTANDLAVDIGSNDGTLLQGFKDRGVRVLGIEPTDVARLANERGIPTVQNFFNETVARRIAVEHGAAKVITATNVFAHTNNLYDELRGIGALLAPDGVFISESQYLLDIVQKLEVDTIYHEHLRFYALRPMLELFRRAGMCVVDAERIPAAGGSIRVFAMVGKQSSSPRVAEILAAETASGLDDGSGVRAFAFKARDAKRRLLALLAKCAEDPKTRILGVGSPARANSLLNFVGIDGDLVDYLVERAGSPKIGLYTPGTHLKVEDEARLFAEQPEYALILSWHIADELVAKLKQLGFRGRCIIPLPEPRIIE